jgi:VanZ family protein
MSASNDQTFFEKSFVIKAYLPVFIWAVVILALSTGSGIQLPDTGISADKLGHFVSYGLVNWLALRALQKTGKLASKSTWMALLLVSVYGILLEIVQWAFFPHRFFEVWDMVANIAGAVMSYFAYNFFTTKT